MDTPEEVKGLWGYKATLAKDYMYVEGLGNGCERAGYSCGGKCFYFGSTSELTRKFAEKMLSTISSAKDKLWNAPASVFIKDSTHQEISRLEKAYKHYERIAGHDEPYGWFLPASKEDYELYQHVHDRPYQKDAVMGTLYIPDDYDEEQESTPQEVFSLCLLLRRLQRY